MKIKNSFVKSAGIVTLGNVAAQAVNLLVLPLISRLYGTEVFGEMAIWVATASVVCVVAALGLNGAIMLPKEEEEAKRVFSVNFVLMGVISVVTYAVMLAWVRWNICVFMLLYTLGAVGVNMLTVYQNRQGNDKALFNNYWIGASVNALVTVLAGWITGGSLTGMMTAAVATFAVRWVMLMSYGSPFVRTGIKDVAGVIKEYREFVTWQLGSNAVSKYTMKWQLSVMRSMFGSGLAGTYSMCDKIMGAPLRMVAGPVGDIYFRELAKREREGEAREGLTWRFVAWVMALSVPFVAAILAWSDEAAAWLLGEKWREAGEWAAWLSAAYVFGFCGNALTYCRVARRRQMLDFGFEVLKLVMVTASVASGYVICGTAESVVSALSIGLTLYYISDVAVDLWLTEDRSKVIKFLILAAAYSVIFYLVKAII